MRREYPQVRDVLERTWKLLEKAPVKVPEDLKTSYKRVMTPDGHDWQPKKGVKYTWGTFVPPAKEKSKAEKKKGDVKMDDGDDVKSSETERGDDAAVRDAMEIDACKLTADNVLAGSKRKHSPPPPTAHRSQEAQD
jgi:hypothetical protein